MSAATSDTVTTACPGCLRAVRVPVARLADAPRCPACKAALLPGEPVVLNDETFGPFVARTELPVVVDFWAPWCGPCRTFGPVVAEAAAALAPLVRFAKVNTDESPATAGRLGIRSIPTVVLFRHGRELARQPGALPPGPFREWLAASGVTG